MFTMTMTKRLVAPARRTVSAWLRALAAISSLIAISPAVCTSAGAQVAASGPYAPYAFLIGEWDVASESGGPAAAVTRFRWGPNRSYLWFATSVVANGAEQPHFEGFLMWNGVRKNLDMLVAMDLQRGLVQERGVVSVAPDGTVVRDITASYSEGAPLPPRGQTSAGPAGATVRFRQTFKPVSPNRVLTTVLRESEQGWVPTFPGSDRLVMTRRPTG
jgi:hypothetical protein